MKKKEYIPPQVTRYPIYREGPMLCLSYGGEGQEGDEADSNRREDNQNKWTYKLLYD